MKRAAQILDENPVRTAEILAGADKAREILEHLIWLGQVEVINYVAVNEEHKLELLRKIK